MARFPSSSVGVGMFSFHVPPGDTFLRCRINPCYGHHDVGWFLSLRLIKERKKERKKGNLVKKGTSS
jgi:hypothetical protein